MDKPKREAILDLSKYVNERIRVKFTGGREGEKLLSLKCPTISLIRSIICYIFEVTGILKGYDQLLNLVLDEVEEEIQGKMFRIVLNRNLCSGSEPEPHVRMLGLVVLRGPTITLVSPVDGSEEIANPFNTQE
jgi:U6 snRNA-associated Sm-like protein LSm7